MSTKSTNALLDDAGKSRFVETCYTNGIIKPIKNKDKIIEAIRSTFGIHYAFRTIRRLYPRFVLELYGKTVPKYHLMMLRREFRAAVYSGDINVNDPQFYSKIFNLHKSKCWMQQFATKKYFKQYLCRNGLDLIRKNRQRELRDTLQSQTITPNKRKRPDVSLSNKKRHEEFKRRKEKIDRVKKNQKRWDDFIKVAELELYETYVAINKTLTQWLPVWEWQKANGEKGLPGSPNIKGAIHGIATIYSIIFNKDKKEVLERLGLLDPVVDDAGCGVNCFLKIIRILMNCACAGFEYKSMLGMFLKEYRHEDAIIYVPMIMQVLRAIREIDEKVSLYHGTKICGEPFVLKFNQGWEPSKASNGNLIKSNYKKFLAQECEFKKDISKRKGRIVIMFCEGWLKDDLESITRSFGDFQGSGVGIVFIANNPTKPNNYVENGERKKIRFDTNFFKQNMNYYVNNEDMKFVQVRDTFPISAGKTQLTGYILARKCIVPDSKTNIDLDLGADLSSISPQRRGVKQLTQLPILKNVDQSKHFSYFNTQRPLAKIVCAAVQTKIENIYDFPGHPCTAFCAEYVDAMGNQGTNFTEEAVEEYLKSWYMNYFLDENGESIVTDRRLPDGDQPYSKGIILEDYRAGMEDIEKTCTENKRKENYVLYFCDKCGITGSKTTLWNHFLYKHNDCEHHNLKSHKNHMVELDNEVEEDELEKRFSLTFKEVENIKNIERKKIYQLVKESLTDMLTHNSDTDLEREYLIRLSVNISRNQAFRLARGNKTLRNVRYVASRFVVTFEDGYAIDLPISEITPATDSETRKRLLELAKLPSLQQLTWLKTDNCFLHFVEGVTYRIRVAINHPHRKRYFKMLGRTLIISITIDGAPKGKNAQMLSITFTVINEGIKFTSSDVTPLVLTTGAESDSDTYKVCAKVGAVIKRFKDSVNDANPFIVVDNEGKEYSFNKIFIVNSSDLAAQCKADGWGATGSEWPHTCVIGLNHRACGPYGTDYGRSKGVDRNDTDTAVHDTFLRDWSPNIEPGAKWEKPGDRPVAIISCEQRQKLFDDVQEKVGRLYANCETEEEKKAWLDEAREAARAAGHAQYKPPIFGVFIMDMPSFCALHFKTTAVKDILVHGASLLTLWDSSNEHQIISLGTMGAKLGPSLQCYFKEIESAPEFKGQLESWSKDHSLKCLGNAAKRANRDINVEFKRLSNFLATLSEDAKISTRLIGVMANVILSKPWVYVNILIKSLQRIPATTTQQKKKRKKYELGISILAVKLFCLKDIVLNLSITSYDVTEIQKLGIRYRFRAKQMEYIHTYFLPNMSRMYDVVATCLVPHIFDRCIDLRASPGSMGLLESKEKFHQDVVQVPTFPLTLEAAVKLGRKSWTYQVLQNIGLKNLYKETREDTLTPYPSTEIRQVIKDGNLNNNKRGEGEKRGKVRHQRSYIYDSLETPYLQSEDIKINEPWNMVEERCGCGRFQSFDECDVCNFGQIKILWQKTHSCAKLLIRREVLKTTRQEDAKEVKGLLKWLSKMDSLNILRHLHADLDKL